LFLIVFAETGLVIAPFLPGDSLLFVTGTLAASGAMDIRLLMVLLIISAVLGDTVNYWAGYCVGPMVFRMESSRLLNKKHLERTHLFYEKYGGKTIIIARFIPIIRTFAPFVAGIGRMTYRRFVAYNIIGGSLWVTLFLLGGFFFGNISFVKKNLTSFIFFIIIFSIMPGVIEYTRARYGKARA
ncbi:MAG: VTT domain-containing protein, partial [Dissulfurimicrobium sp.]